MAEFYSLEQSDDTTDVFLSHDWGTDELGRNNHDRVSAVNDALKQLGYRTWFDSDRMTGDIVDTLCDGIDNTRLVLVFVTQKYVKEVQSGQDNDTKKLEFKYAMRRKGAKNMIPVIMEERMKNPGDWKGPIGLTLGGILAVRMFYNFDDIDEFKRGMTDLKKEIDTRLNKQQADIPHIPISSLSISEAKPSSSQSLTRPTTQPAIGKPSSVTSVVPVAPVQPQPAAAPKAARAAPAPQAAPAAPAAQATTAAPAPQAAPVRQSSETILTIPRICKVFEDQPSFIVRINNCKSLYVNKSTFAMSKDRIFRHFIDEILSQPQKEPIIELTGLEDLYLMLLKNDIQVEDISPGSFRKILDLSVDTGSDWLEMGCYRWLSDKMKTLHPIGDKDKLFMFKESLHILEKGRDPNFIVELIARVASKDNSSFISMYFEEIEEPGNVELDYLLQAGGSNCELFMKIIIGKLTSKGTLGEDVKFLLTKMNLALCCEVNMEMYTKMFNALNNLRELSTADAKLYFELAIETTKMIKIRNDERNEKQLNTKILYDEIRIRESLKRSKVLIDISEESSRGKLKSMFEVVELILRVMYTDKSAATAEKAEMEGIIRDLVALCSRREIKKVSHHYLAMISSALKLSLLKRKEKVIELLKMIQKSPSLSTSTETVIICRNGRIEVIPEQDRKHHFVYQHPCNVSCKRTDSKCGFLLRSTQVEGHCIYEYKLCVDQADYEQTGLHYHGNILADDTCMFTTSSGETRAGEVITVPHIWWYWWQQWLPELEFVKWEFNKRYVALDVSKFLVAKEIQNKRSHN